MNKTIDSPYILAATAQTFPSLVIENSLKGPVLVNFWSKKAGPCIRQYPILDKIIHHYNGCLLLINCDMESEPSIKREQNITSIPTLKLFHQQQVIETLHGYQSETDLLRLLNQHVALPSDLKLGQAIQLYTEGQQDAAYQAISQIILDDPTNPRVPLTLAKLLKHERRFDEALSLLQSLPEAIKSNQQTRLLLDELNFIKIAQPIKDIKQLIKEIEQATDQNQQLELQKQLAAFYIINQDYENGLKILFEMMTLDATFSYEFARLSMIKVFQLLGKNHPLVETYRNKISH